MDSSIIATAILKDVTLITDNYKQEHPEFKDNNGYYTLVKDSVRVFNPISEAELKTIISSFKRFGNCKPYYEKSEVDIEKLDKRINDNGGILKEN